MTYDEIINAVDGGAKFTVNLVKRTFRLSGKVIDLSGCILPSHDDILLLIEELYGNYKHSLPSERSESHRRYYFKALPEKELTDADMMFGERRETARCRIELTVLLAIIDGTLTWNPSWGTWFWQSEHDQDLVILRKWIEPDSGE